MKKKLINSASALRRVHATKCVIIRVKRCKVCPRFRRQLLDHIKAVLKLTSEKANTHHITVATRV